MIRSRTAVKPARAPVASGVAAALAAGLALAAASSPAAAASPAPDAAATPIAYDPWEGANRGLFRVAMGLDHGVVAPLAHGYMRITPAPVQHRVSAFVYNLGEPSTALEDVLQGHGRRAGRATGRFVINTTVGVLGLFDVASGMGLHGHESDFGQTLGRYGAQAGPYVYVPLIGPSDLRDGLGRIVDVVTDPIGFVTGPITSTSGAARFGVSALDERVGGDAAFHALHDATDPYVTARSAYTQHRAAVVRQATGEAAVLPDFDAGPGEP